MQRFESTTLWQATLATQLEPDHEASNRALLRVAYESFRSRAALLANEIALDLPEFTVHDITHLDALWEMAQLVSGPSLHLTPAEAFVLGGAFLIHDLGMGLAAYPDGVSELKQSALWSDTVAAQLKSELGRLPTSAELKDPSKQIEDRALRNVLRELHAKHAERLCLISWKDRLRGSEKYHLIEDPTLRNTYGPIIGKIAHSHWWSVEELTQMLPAQMGAPGGFNNSWTVDPIKLACILRAADACHLDERRAPGFLAALRKPSGLSSEHWKFQEKLYQPRLEVDRLIYSSKTDFLLSEASAWWICFDAIKGVDYELRHIDSLLADTNRPRLAAKGVSYADDANRMSKLIGTANWLPVDAKIKVGDVARLIGSLGGEKLYGRNDLVPLRELIQNSTDAVRARRTLENRDSSWGAVIVRHGKDEYGRWIEVEDSGVGMSVSVLTGPFLDFGTSFWGSPLMHKELPGLESKGFSSTGQFGVGFYSVFMWGDKIQVVTRRAADARDQTLVLEFYNGLAERPIIRKADPAEQLIDGGSKVRVWLRNEITFEHLLSGRHEQAKWTLSARCAWLCPALDVDLYVEENRKKLVVKAFDWTSIKPSALLRRLIGSISKENKKEIEEFIRNIGPKLRLIKNASGEIVGRACVTRRDHFAAPKKWQMPGLEIGAVTIGGFRSCGLSDIAGVFIGKPHTAARNIGMPIAEPTPLSSWASDQAFLVDEGFGSSDQAEFAQIVYIFGGATQQLHIAESSTGWKSFDDLSNGDYGNEVLLVQDAALYLARKDFGEIELYENVISVAMGAPGILQTGDHHLWIDWPTERKNAGWPSEWRFYSQVLAGAAIEAVALSWKQTLAETLKLSEKSTDRKTIEREVGTCAGGPIILRVMIIRRRTETSTKY